MNISAVLEKYKQRLQMDESMLNSQSDYPDRLLLKEIDELKIIIEALQFQQNVVRCGECKLWYSYPNDKHCSRHISKVCDDGFCFEGKRRDEE